MFNGSWSSTFFFFEVEFLGSSHEAEGAIELVVIGSDLCVNVVVCHVVGDRVHGSLDEEQSTHRVLVVVNCV